MKMLNYSIKFIQSFALQSVTMITSVISRYYYKLTVKYICRISESCLTSYIMIVDVLRNTVLKTIVHM